MRLNSRPAGFIWRLVGMRFNSAGQAIAYYQHCNPARARYYNMFEPDHGQQISVSQFSGDHPHDIYAAIVGALKSTQKAFGNAKEWKAFASWYLDTNRDERFSKDELAQEFGVKRRQLNRYLEGVMDFFAGELFERDLIAYLPENIEFIH